MFKSKPTPADNALDDAIAKIMSEMSNALSDTERYSAMVKQLSKLHKLKEKSAPARVSPDTVLLVAGNLAGILLIVGYEHTNVVTSKAISLLLKLK